MDFTGDRFAWGTETVRRSDGIPFLVYEPRRRSAAELLDDLRHWGDRVHLVRGEQRMTDWPAGDITDDRT